MVYSIADYKFDILVKYGYSIDKLKEYEADLANTDCSFTVSDEELNEEFRYALKTTGYEFGKDYLEFVAINRKLAEWLPLNNAFLLHSVVVDVEGEGVAFMASSGTGKTTHMLLWQKLLGDKMKIVNGDKPFIRFFNDEPNTPYAYGAPWQGKEEYGCNMRTKLKHLCFIERSKENSCEKIDIENAVNLIFNQVYMPKEPIAMMNTIKFIDNIVSNCSLWKIKCNMDISAATTAYNTIFNK